jgi:hypothetical protein
MFTPSRIAAFGVTHVHLINDDLALDHWVCLNIRGKTGEKHAFHWKKMHKKTTFGNQWCLGEFTRTSLAAKGLVNHSKPLKLHL